MLQEFFTGVTEFELWLSVNKVQILNDPTVGSLPLIRPKAKMSVITITLHEKLLCLRSLINRLWYYRVIFVCFPKLSKFQNHKKKFKKYFLQKILKRNISENVTGGFFRKTKGIE